MYRVIEDFVDLKDSRHEYHRGDAFPRGGVSVSEDRIAELTGSKNLCRKPLIEKVVEEVKETTPEVVEDPPVYEAPKSKNRKKRVAE